MVQMVEHLLCKCKALTSNPSLTLPHPKKKEKERVRKGFNKGEDCAYLS
jgi:hypothetical protein